MPEISACPECDTVGNLTTRLCVCPNCKLTYEVKILDSGRVVAIDFQDYCEYALDLDRGEYVVRDGCDHELAAFTFERDAQDFCNERN